MHLPQVSPDFIIPDLPTYYDKVSKVYKLIKKLYGLKDVGRTWNNHLTPRLIKHGWKQSTIDECLFTKKGAIFILYVDDACIISPSKTLIKSELISLQSDYDLTDDGGLQDYLVTRFDRSSDGSVTLAQPRIINPVLEIVGLHKDENVKV